MDVIYRNLERLIYSDFEGEKEPLEPMTEWKWSKLYQIAKKYNIGAWVSEGLQRYADDFFLQMSPTLRQQFMDLPTEKLPESMERYQLQINRSKGPLHQLSPASLRAYLSDLIRAIKNIEE